jgi:hypothetical protein
MRTCRIGRCRIPGLGFRLSASKYWGHSAPSVYLRGPLVLYLFMSTILWSSSPTRSYILYGFCHMGVNLCEIPGFLAGLCRYTILPFRMTIFRRAIIIPFVSLKGLANFFRTTLLVREIEACSFLSLPASSDFWVSVDSLARRW